jgi:hypothetical protein
VIGKKVLIIAILFPKRILIDATSGLVTANEPLNLNGLRDTCMLQVIAAEGEQKASKALREASLVMAESSSALQLRYLQASGGIHQECSLPISPSRGILASTHQYNQRRHL